MTALAVQRRRGKPKSRFYTITARISRRFEPKVAASFRAAMGKLQSYVDEDALASSLAGENWANAEFAAGTGRISGILVGDPRLYQGLLDASTATGHAGAEVLSGVTGMNAKFNARHPDVIMYARTQTANLVVQVSDEMKEAIRVVIAAGSELGLTTVQQARAIREIVGLSPSTAAAPLRLEQELRAGRFTSTRRLSATDKAQIRSRLSAGTMTDSFIAGVRERYAKSLLNHRALTIARTETLRAVHAGQTEGWSQAMQQGVLPKTARRMWIVTLDDRLKHWMVPGMNPQGRAINEMFETPEGAVLHPPSRPNCRCSVGLTFPGYEGVL